MVSAFTMLQHCSVGISTARNKYRHCVACKHYVHIMSFTIFKSLMMAFYKGCNTSHSVIQYCTTTNTAVTDRSLLSTVPPLFLQRLSIKISTTASSSIKYASLKPLPSFRSKFPHAVPKVKSITTFNSVL